MSDKPETTRARVLGKAILRVPALVETRRSLPAVFTNIVVAGCCGGKLVKEQMIWMHQSLFSRGGGRWV